MKLKKRQFARLKDIAESVNHVLPGTGIKLDQLIADIESVQKVKTVQEKPLKREVYERPSDFMERIYDQHRKDVRNDFIKQGASSYDPNAPFIRGLRDAVEARSKPNPNNISDFLDEVLVLSNKEPKIGDVGFFWDSDPNYYTVYGKISDLKVNSFQHESGNWFNYFSKTPPELR